MHRRKLSPHHGTANHLTAHTLATAPSTSFHCITWTTWLLLRLSDFRASIFRRAYYPAERSRSALDHYHHYRTRAPAHRLHTTHHYRHPSFEFHCIPLGHGVFFSKKCIGVPGQEDYGRPLGKKTRWNRVRAAEQSASGEETTLVLYRHTRRSWGLGTARGHSIHRGQPLKHMTVMVRACMGQSVRVRSPPCVVLGLVHAPLGWCLASSLYGNGIGGSNTRRERA